VEELMNQQNFLKETVQRLSTELARYQAKLPSLPRKEAHEQGMYISS